LIEVFGWHDGYVDKGRVSLGLRFSKLTFLELDSKPLLVVGA
jgi:hypothetical protein